MMTLSSVVSSRVAYAKRALAAANLACDRWQVILRAMIPSEDVVEDQRRDSVSDCLALKVLEWEDFLSEVECGEYPA